VDQNSLKSYYSNAESVDISNAVDIHDTGLQFPRSCDRRHKCRRSIAAAVRCGAAFEKLVSLAIPRTHTPLVRIVNFPYFFALGRVCFTTMLNRTWPIRLGTCCKNVGGKPLDHFPLSGFGIRLSSAVSRLQGTLVKTSSHSDDDVRLAAITCVTQQAHTFYASEDG
jgi:hypothetical protein